MLIDWINDVLVGERIIVKDLAEDLYDGQVLQKLFGKIEAMASLWNKDHRVPKVNTNFSLLFEIIMLSRFCNIVSESSEKLEGEKLNVAEVTQSEIAQKQKLQTVLERINDSLKLSSRNIRWNVDCKAGFSLLYIFIKVKSNQKKVYAYIVN